MLPLAVLAEEIQAGSTVGSNWIAESPLPPRPGVQRWEGAGVTDGAPVEILRLSPEADPLQQRAFLDFHRTLSEQPAGMPLLYSGTDSTIIRAFPRASLSDLDRRLSPEEVVDLVGWYGPALQGLGAAAGGLGMEAFVIDGDGVFRIAPLGQPDRPAPMPTAARAPEAEDDAAPTLEIGLYNLGVALYRALTGEYPIASQDHSGHLMPPEPPSQKVAGLSHRADRVLMALLDPLPERRDRALPAPPLSPPAFTFSDAGGAVAPAFTAEVAPDKAPPKRALAGAHERRAPAPTADLASAPHIVVIVPRRLRPVVVRKAAGWMEVSEEIANTLALAGLPLPVYGAPNQNAARRRVNQLAELRVPARVVAMKPSLPFYTAVWAALLVASGGVAAIVKLPGIVTVGALVMGALSIPAAIGHDIWYSRQVRASLDRIAEARREPEGPKEASQKSLELIEHVRALQEQMKTATLSAHTESDLMTALEVTMEGLQDLAAAEKSANQSDAMQSHRLRTLFEALRREVKAIEAQMNSISTRPDGTLEVELGTLLTRAMAARREAERILADARV
jgi:hypothetical protein